MNNFKRLTPFKRCVLQNFPFIEEDFDALTNYALLCKVVEYLNKVINAQNEVTEQTEILTEAFNNLKNYVDNYFDNLDVQEEINNKLDEMTEAGTIADIIAGYIQLRGILAYDTVASMKSATNLIDGSFAETYGYYTKGDGGSAKYKIREVTNQDVVDEIGIIALNDENLVAELIFDNPVNAKQIGCKTDGSDNSAILNTYFSNYGKGLFFPNGIYSISSEIDTIGSVVMDNDAWLQALNSMDCCVHINKNLIIPSGSFANNYPKNLEFKVNVDCNKLANTGIRTDKLHWAKLVLSVKNPVVYGVYTRYDKTKGHAENTFDIQCTYDTEDGTNTATGAYIGGSDDIYNNIVSINTKYGCELIGGNNSIRTIHCWLVNSDLWEGSVMLKITNSKNHIGDLIVDTYETGIAFASGYNLSSGVFDLYVDFMYGLINTKFIPAELRSSYVLWNFAGLTGNAQNNSNLVISNYVGNDTDTAKISLGGNGICPFNTVLGYSNDYISPTWIYSLNYCPEGQFHFRGDSNVSGKPVAITAGGYNIITKNTPYGKIQEMIGESTSKTTGYTTYNPDTNLPVSGFNFYWKRMFNKYGTGTNAWGEYASFYVSEPTA